MNGLHFKRKSPDLVSALLTRASKIAAACDMGSFASQSEIIASLVHRITVAQDKVTIEIERKKLAERLLDQEALSTSEVKDRQAIMIEVLIRFRRRGVETKLIVLDARNLLPSLTPISSRLSMRSHEWFGRIASGEANGLGDIARTERLCRTYVTRVLCLAFLAPEITKAILAGQQPTELTAKRLICSALEIPLLWTDQFAFLSPEPQIKRLDR